MPKKGRIEGKTIFCIGRPGQRIWVEQCPKCRERLSLEDLHEGDEWKWDRLSDLPSRG